MMMTVRNGLKGSEDKVDMAGELLIRALAVLAPLAGDSNAEHEQIIKHAALALHHAALVSPVVAQSLSTHPPAGIDLKALVASAE